MMNPLPNLRPKNPKHKYLVNTETLWYNKVTKRYSRIKFHSVGGLDAPPACYKKGNIMDTIIASILVAIITGGLSLIGVIITNANSNNKIEQQLVTNQAVVQERIEHLTEEVRKHNTFDRRITTLESKIEMLERGKS